MNQNEQLAIQAMYDAQIGVEEKIAKAEKPRSTLGPVATDVVVPPETKAPVKRGRKPKVQV